MKNKRGRRGQATILVIMIFVLMVAMVAIVTPILRPFIAGAQSGASDTESLVWAAILPIFAISLIAFIIGFSNLNRSV
jgi:hypothetical protein